MPAPAVVTRNDDENVVEEEEEDEEEEAPTTEKETSKLDNVEPMDTSTSQADSDGSSQKNSEKKGASSIQARIQRLLGPAKPPDLPKQGEVKSETKVESKELEKHPNVGHKIQQSDVTKTEEIDTKETSIDTDKQGEIFDTCWSLSILNSCRILLMYLTYLALLSSVKAGITYP